MRHLMIISLCLTLALGSAGPAFPAEVQPSIERVEIGPNRAFLVNGKPFFPLFAWLQGPKNFPTLKECGMNATAGDLPGEGGVKDAADYLERVRGAGLYGVVHYAPGLNGNPALLGYIQGDEPDLTQKKNGTEVVRSTPAETLKRYQAIKAADSTRPVFMTLTSHFMPIFQKKNTWLAALYPEYVKAADVIGFDVYPIYGWNKPEWLHLVHDGTEQLANLAGGRPIYAWIETSKGGQFTGTLERQHAVTPAHIRAEVWMAICRGATAIGYFTHIWKPGYKQFGVPEENRKALRQINDQITRLTPHLLGEPPRRDVTLQAEGGVKVDLLARTHGDTLSVFAVNYDSGLKTTRVTIRVEGLAADAEVAVVDEGRSLKVERGAFSDTFAPLAVHIYQLRPGSR